MEIRTKNKLIPVKVKELPMMKLCLIYDTESRDYQIAIKTPNKDAIIIRNASNCREPCVLCLSTDADVLYAGKIDNLNMVDVELAQYDGD